MSPKLSLLVSFQAQEFCIAGMGPSAQSLILGGRWSSRARNRFKTLTSGRSAIVSLYSILHGVMRVDLHISMEAGDVSVADLLVQEGHAHHIPESFESQVIMPPPQQCHPDNFSWNNFHSVFNSFLQLLVLNSQLWVYNCEFISLNSDCFYLFYLQNFQFISQPWWNQVSIDKKQYFIICKSFKTS